MTNQRTVVEALSATEFLPVAYSVDRDGRLVRRALSCGPSDDYGFSGEPIPLTYKEASRYAWEFQNFEGETGYTYTWNPQIGHFDDPEGFEADWNEALQMVEDARATNGEEQS